MARLLILVLLYLFHTSAAFARECGVLELGEVRVWDYQSGVFFDIEGNKIASTVPSRKKLIYNYQDYTLIVEQVKQKVKRNKKNNLRFSIISNLGKKIIFTRSASKMLGVFEEVSGEAKFLLLDPDQGSVYKASISKSILDNKIKFSLDEDADFYVYNCNAE